MRKKIQKQKQSGFTLIEMVVGIAIMGILMVGIINTYALLTTGVKAFREKTTTSTLADYYLEIARNMPYAQIGTANGNPHGTLADQPNPISTTVNGNPYHIYYSVSYVDDPADGTALAGTDPAPADYKDVKLYVQNATTGSITSFETSISPKGLENLTNGGALFAKVFNSVGQPIAGASVHITNNTVNPIIDITRTTDSTGNWIEVGLPNSVDGYHVVVTKNNYSSDQTYPITQPNPNPTKPDATISNGQVTQVSFSIDLLSTLTFKTLSQTCAVVPNIGVEVKGSKIIGTNPNVLKFDNPYTSDASGQIALNNLEWDTYTPSLTDAAHMLYGSSPIQQINILPSTNQTFTLILGPVTPNSLLVIVKDAGSGNPLENATVELSSTSDNFDSIKQTGGSIFTQSDWSGGAGQANFTVANQYYQDDGNVDTQTIPTGLRLKNLGTSYADSGTLESSSFDSGTNATTYSTFSWLPTSQNPSTTLKFQIATNNDDATWNYLGPDGTSGTYYTVPGSSISTTNNTGRYIRYKAFLSTSDTAQTPVLTSVNLNYISGCFTPGQAMFAGISAGNDYTATISLPGYQTQTITGLNVSGYNTLQVMLSQ